MKLPIHNKPVKLFTSLLLILSTPVIVQAENTLRFVTLDFAPFIYGENQNVAGPGYEIIAKVCELAKINCTYDIYPWRRAQELMKSGQADGMMVIGRNPAREKWIRFSPPHFRTEYGIFVNKNSPLKLDINSDLAGLRIGVFAPSNTATQLASINEEITSAGHEPIIIEERPDDTSGFRKLTIGRLDAVYSNRDRGRMIIDAEGLQDEIRYESGYQEILYYAGFARTFKNSQLLDRFDKVWKRLFKNGEAQNIIHKYGLEPATSQ